MTQFSGLWTTTSSGAVGHQVAGYTQAQWATFLAIIAACSGKEGVAPGYESELACSDGGLNTVDVAPGGALVDGKVYHNDAVEAVNIPSAVGGGNTRIDRIVLRADWAGFDVAITRIAGTDAASPTAPAIVQTSGTIYDIMLCQVLVDTSGAVTVTDERVWAIADRIPSMYGRQGGSATVWSTQGTTNYEAGQVRVQAGVVRWTGSAATIGNVIVTFPQAFGYTPIVFLSPRQYRFVTVAVDTLTSKTQLVFQWESYDNTLTTVDFNWIAIGPE